MKFNKETHDTIMKYLGKGIPNGITMAELCRRQAEKENEVMEE